MELDLLNIVEGEDKTSAFTNCIRNHYRHLRKWAKRTLTNCFRIYDKEIAHYPVAIDYYAGRFCVHYFSRGANTEEAPIELKEEIDQVLQTLFGITLEQIYWRTRAKAKPTRQYEKVAAIKQYFTVLEFGVKFKINLMDYLDTGLFLDHRETRKWVASLSNNKRMLNLFAYTCSFSVHSAMQGAVFTKSVDMSNTYTEWGRENFLLNGLPINRHEIVRADCLKFLDDEIRSGARYDIIVIDPPTISRSKKMDQLFDIQVDYVALLRKAMMLLNRDGSIIFSTNSRRFVFDNTLFQGCRIEDVSHKTLPLDFKDPNIHRCWKLTV